MTTARILQAVGLMLMLALAASCATSNEYVNKIFKPRNADSIQTVKQQKKIKFLEMGGDTTENEVWVKWENKEDSSDTESKPAPVMAEKKSEPSPEQQPIVKTTTQGGVRTKSKRE
jgi:hypothetical protein